MKKLINVRKIMKTCDVCPSQWEGITTDNRQIYIRYRWDVFSVNLGKKNDMSHFAAVNGREILYFEDYKDNWMTYDELKEATKGIICFPEFESNEMDWVDKLSKV